jgi:arylsulfatase A-like enzyme
MAQTYASLNRRSFLKTMGAGSAALLWGCQPGIKAGASGRRRFAAPGKDRPNFLFLFTDDQTFRAVNALGNAEVKTPNMDRLIRRGVTFTHCFNQGSFSGAVCVASRAMLNTGRYLWQCGGGQCRVSRGKLYPLWGQTLGQAGYDTFMTGKWHNGNQSLQASFKRIGPTGPGMYDSTDYQGAAYHRPAAGNTWSPYDKTQKGHWLNVDGETVHSSKRWADSSIDYLTQHAAHSDDPFFMYVAFHAPHDPRQSPKEFVDMYPLDKIKIPPNYLPEHPFDQGDHKLRDEILAPFPRTEEAVKVHLQEYYAIATHADHHIGRILTALEKSRKADNTVIIFSADHGLAVGQHGLMGKQNMYDHSIRMPFVMAGPGLKAGKQIDAMMHLQSLFATTCDMAGIALPSTVQYPSLVPLLTGEKEKLHDEIYGAYLKYQRMVRTEKWKLIRYPHNRELQLFNLMKDPWETKDLAENPRYAKIVSEMDGRLQRLVKDMHDPMDFEEIKLDPNLPNVLIIGDSISLGYTPYVRRALSGKVNLVHAPGNNSGTTLGRQKLTEWLGDMEWDLIHFNWGLHDLKHVKAGTGKNSNDPNDPQQADISQYRENMEYLVQQMRQTGAALIFATTTPYPAGVKPCRIPEDAQRYNQAARGIMKAHGIAINDLYSLVLPRLEELQNPVNVHFSAKGSEVLAQEVIRAIMSKLEAVTATSGSKR